MSRCMECGRKDCCGSFMESENKKLESENKRLRKEFAFSQLMNLRKLCRLISQEEFISFWLTKKCDASYALEQWFQFQDSPLLFLTWHTHGEDLLKFMQGVKNDQS